MSFGNVTLVTLLSNSHWKKVTFCTFPKITWVLSLRNSTFDWLFIISVIVLWSSLVWKVFKVRVVGAQKLDNPAAHRTDQNELRSFYKKLLKPWKLPFARRNPRWNVSQPVKEKIFRIFSSAWLNWLNWQLHFWPQNFVKTLTQWRSWCLIGGRGKDCLVPKGHISLRMRQTLGLFVLIAMMSREEIPHTYSRRSTEFRWSGLQSKCNPCPHPLSTIGIL